MPRAIRIASLSDPRVREYRNLKDRDLAAEGGRFIAEGEQVVRRLLASRFQTESVLLADKRAEEIAPIVPPEVSTFVASDQLVHEIIGFKFHSGVMAVGLRGQAPTLDDIAPPGDSRLTLIVCPELANTENLGGLIRIAAAFGAHGMILGERSCDPFFRQSIRVSMGTVFSLPIVQSRDIRCDLAELRRRGVELIATVLDDSAEQLDTVQRPRRAALMFGNEAQGLSQEHAALCDRRITIPMKLGTDSLNVMVAAGVILHHFTR